MTTTLNVRDLMQIRVHVVPPEMPLAELEQEFIDKRVSGFPVVDDEQLIGVVSRSDIVRQLDVERRLAENTSDFYWDRSGFHEEPAESMLQIASRVGQRIEDLRVRDLMSRHLVAVSADDSLAVLAKILGTLHPSCARRRVWAFGRYCQHPRPGEAVCRQAGRLRLNPSRAGPLGPAAVASLRSHAGGCDRWFRSPSPCRLQPLERRQRRLHQPRTR